MRRRRKRRSQKKPRGVCKTSSSLLMISHGLDCLTMLKRS
ncbi:hypothetical protein AZE42_10558, partial [Rhizopogon vesiculosus]